ELCTRILTKAFYLPCDLHRIPTGRHPKLPPVDPSSIHVGFWFLASTNYEPALPLIIPPFTQPCWPLVPDSNLGPRVVHLDHFTSLHHHSSTQVHLQLHPTFQSILVTVPHPRLYSFWIHFPSYLTSIFRSIVLLLYPL